MITFVECSQAGADGKNLGFAMVSQDGTRHEFAITVQCFLRLFAMGWKAARPLGPSPESGESPRLDADVRFAITDMAPAICLSSGPLVLTLPVDHALLKILQDGMKALTQVDGRRPH